VLPLTVVADAGVLMIEPERVAVCRSCPKYRDSRRAGTTFRSEKRRWRCDF
jgi:hypothetical protein